MLTIERRRVTTFVSGSNIESRQYGEILAILSSKWHAADPYLDDICELVRNCAPDMLLRLSDGQIDGVLRTKRISTGGDPARLPATFEQLVGPYWSRHDSNPDTRVLVDLTKLDGASGVAKSLIPLCLDRFPEPNLGTFSPSDAAALHTRFGAWPVHHIKDARRRHSSPHVVVMCYRGFSSKP